MTNPNGNVIPMDTKNDKVPSKTEPSTPIKSKPLWTLMRPSPMMLLALGATVQIPSEPDRIPPIQSAALKSRIDEGRYPIYLFGLPGAGKSSAAAVAARCFPHVSSGYYIETNRKTGLEEQVPVYLDVHQPYFADAKFLCHCIGSKEHLSKIFTRIQKASLFVMDDVGTRGLTAAGTEAMLDILNARGGLPMIITGNHSPLILPKEIGDERVSSRIMAGGPACWIEFPKQDQRISA